VKRGELFTITKECEPVAILKPVEACRKGLPKDIIREIKELRKTHSTGDISIIKDMIEKGRTRLRKRLIFCCTWQATLKTLE